MNHITMFGERERAYSALQFAASYLNMRAADLGKSYWYTVEDCYFDFGQNWMWTTIIAHDPSMGTSWQAIYPNMQERILEATSYLDITDTVEELVNKW